MPDLHTLGIDIGSTASKCVVLKNGNEILSTAVIPVGAGTSGPKRVIEKALWDAGIEEEIIDFTVATGYGRNTFESADDQISELSCHAKGAAFLFDGVRTIIDIGGQDAKVLSLLPNGKLSNFQMNDKCAAGTGRFMEVMARVLDVDISDFSKYGSRSENRVDISSTCTVFAETEVISHLAKAAKIEDVIAGIHRSVASRVGSLAKRTGITEPVVMTGGVAKNAGIVKALEEEIGVGIKTNQMCQIAGALGASLYAYEFLIEEEEYE